MMSDLPQEMRDLAKEPIVTGPEGRKLLRKGADEIERLREALRLAKADMMKAVRHVEREITYVPPLPNGES